LVDAYITGEGEVATTELLKGNLSYAGINDLIPLQIDNLNELPIADYSDLDISLYPKQFFMIITTRGCIRNCNFCCNSYPTYRWRNSTAVVNEMVVLYNKYGVRDFMLADSTSNGNPKEFLKLIKTIIEYNDAGILPKIKWSCSFTCLSETLIGEDVYKNLGKSGCDFLGVGIESGSQKVRFEMNKKIKDEDIDFLFNQCRKYKINLSLCFIAGYYTETEEDFQETLDFLTDYSHFTNDLEVSIGVVQAFGLQVGSDVHKNWKQIGFSNDSYNEWTYKDNTPEVRLSRIKRFKKHALEMGYKVGIAKEKMIEVTMNV